MSLTIQLKPLENFGNFELPHYATALAAGADLRAALPDDGPVDLAPGERKLIPTGLAMALPAGYEAQIRPRSGLAYKHGVTVLNTPGTIDADYRGELKVLLINHGQTTFTVTRGERIAQMIITPAPQMIFETVNELNDTTRGAGGYGSTGVK